MRVSEQRLQLKGECHWSLLATSTSFNGNMRKVCAAKRAAHAGMAGQGRVQEREQRLSRQRRFRHSQAQYLGIHRARACGVERTATGDLRTLRAVVRIEELERLEISVGAFALCVRRTRQQHAKSPDAFLRGLCRRIQQRCEAHHHTKKDGRCGS